MHVIMKYDPLCRMIKTQSCQPASVCPRSRFATVHKPVPQQKAEQLLTCPGILLLRPGGEDSGATPATALESFNSEELANSPSLTV
jgi:hypothetical protein